MTWGQWAVAPPAPMPKCPAGQNDLAFALREIAARAKRLADAIEISEAASDRVRDMPPGSSRAVQTSARAQWSRKAEARDRCERSFELALENRRTLMNAHAFKSSFEVIDDPIDADRWARIRVVAAAIPADVDLDDDGDVIRALFAARFCGRDFGDVLDEAIKQAREARS